MKRLIVSAIIGLCVLALFLKFWGVIAEEFSQRLEIFRRAPQVQAAMDEQAILNLRWYGSLKRWFAGCLAGLAIIGPVIALCAWSFAYIQRSLVHVFKIGEHSQIPVHKRDLLYATQIGFGLVNAEQLKQMNGGIDKAFELYERMAVLQSKQFKRLASADPKALPEGETIEMIPVNDETPTFAALLAQGELSRGKPMILGFEKGQPRRGSFLDIYSAAIAGESGSGKTSTMLFLIGSALVAQPVHVFGIDPHYPHPKSLGFKIRPLTEAGLIQMATFKDDMLAMLSKVEQIIDNRLRQVDTDDTPVLLVLDEVAALSRSSIGKAVAHTMERISTEGRKCDVYMLAGSQTWLSSRTGDSSVVRDTLTCAYIHRIKPKQANLLLQDRSEVEKVRKIKQAGEALFCPVGEDSAICRMPFATEADMRTVADLVQAAPAYPVSLPERQQDLPMFQFIQSWRKAYGSEQVGSAELFKLARSAGIMLGEGNEHAQKIKLGQMLSDLEDSPMAEGFTIQAAGTAQRAKQWRLATGLEG